MKSLVNRVTILAASAMVLGTMAYGQTSGTEMKANIPFAFHTESGTFPAGSYTVGESGMNSGIAVATLRNDTTSRKVFVAGGLKDLWSAGSPAVIFRCTEDGGCVLKAIRKPGEAMTFNVARSARQKESAEIVVPLRAISAE